MHIGLLKLESMSLRQDVANPTVNPNALVSTVAQLRELTARMIHHDSITGSSLSYIIQNETVTL
jgi:hypothetical protein